MSADDERPEKMAEIAGLATTIADRILERHEAGISIPPEHFRMFVRAAQMLLDKQLPWPPSVGRLVMEVAERAGETKSISQGSNVVVYLAHPQDSD